jgi:hypothetical protein
MAVPGALHARGVGEGQLGPHLLEQVHDGCHIVLLLLAELAPPVFEDSALADIAGLPSVAFRQGDQVLKPTSERLQLGA